MFGKPKRRAVDVIGLGATLRGHLEKIMAQGFGFVLCTTQRNETRQLFLNLGSSHGWNPGSDVEFRVGENAKGIAGFEPRLVRAG